ncbi:hypothetical protein QK360_00365 [Pseudomonas aeruginosa]|nr:hypothetical protein [Pseudomonas aeruginosa]MDI3744137.1 hypothetical protein [Pseudomonas aeruginosa]HCU2081466.1 hypothetical protein [Pseudomonas aeruginosa]
MKEPNPREGQSDDLALRTYTLIFDAILQCESAEEQRRMISLFLCQSAMLCRFLDGPQAFDDLVRKVRAVEIGPDWVEQVMRMH